MAVRIELKRSNVPGKIPSTSQLQLGELALNTYDGAAYFKKNVGGTETIVQLATTTGTGSGTVTSASHADYADTSGYATNAGNAATAVSASYAFNASNAVSSSYAVTASFANNAPNAVSASYARTASYSDNFNVGNNLTVVGTITAQKLVVQVITSSTEFVTGSTKFGSQLTDTHQFTGSVSITGSLSVNGVDYIQTSASFDGRINGISGSFITSASFNSFTASTNDSLADIKNATASLYAATASIYNATQSLYNATASLYAFTASILNHSSSISASVDALNTFSASILNYTASNNANIAALNAATASLYNATASIYATTQSLSASIGSLSSSFLSTSSSLSIRVSDLEAFSSSLDATFATDAQLNYSSSVLSGSTAYLSSSFLNTSASNSTRIYNLEQFSSSLDATFATDAQLNYSSSVLSGSTAYLSASFLSTSASNSTRILALENFSSSLDAAFATDADLNALSSSFIAFTASINNYTSSNNNNIAALYAATASLNNATASLYNFSASINNFTSSTNDAITDIRVATASLYNFSASINSYTASNNANVAQLYNETASLKAATASLYAATASLYNATQSLYAFSASILNYTSSTNATITQIQNATASLYNATASIYGSTSSLHNFSASILNYTASQNILNGTFATTGSNVFIGNQTITGSIFVTGSQSIAGNLTVTDTITAQKLVVQTISSSVIYSSGSNVFGNDLSNTQIFTGSVSITGSLAVNGRNYLTDSSSFSTRVFNLEQTSASLLAATASLYNATQSLYNATASIYEATASLYAFSASINNFTSSTNNAITQLYNETASILAATASIYNATQSLYNFSASINSFTASQAVLNGTFATTGSNTFRGNQTVTGSLFTSGSNTLVGNTVLSGSVNISGSTNIDGTTNFRNSSTTITGSLLVSGSTTQVGNNTLNGNTTLSGSIIISGSLGTSTPTVRIYGDTQHNGYVRFDPVSTNIDTSISASYIYVSGSTQDLYFSQNGNGYNNVTRLRWLEGNLYSGLLNGGLISTQSSTVYQVSSGSGVIVNLNASFNNNPYPTVQYINWPNLSASIAPLSASYDQSFVAVNSTGQIFAQGTPYSDGQYNTLIPIGVVLHQNHSTINGTQTFASLAYGWKQRSSDFIRAFGPLKLSGLDLYTSSSRGLTVGSGTAWSDGRNYSVDPNNPSYITDAGTTVSKIFRYRQSGSDWVYDTNGGIGYTTIDPTQYSNSGSLTPVGASNWSIQRVYWFPNSVTKAIYVYYGNARYTTEADAIANLQFEPFVEAPNTAAQAVYLGAIVINGTGVFTSANDYKILPAGLFRSIGGTGGGGSSVTTTLAGLSDVNISGPTDGQPLVYSNTSLKWENKSFLSASISGNASTSVTASYAATASFVQNAVSASFATSASAATKAATASYADNFLVSGSLTVGGTITAQTLVVQVITSSVELITGSLTISGSLNALGGVTGSLLGTSSYALDANLLDGKDSTIFATTGSNQFNGNQSISGSVNISSSIAVAGPYSGWFNANVSQFPSGGLNANLGYAALYSFDGYGGPVPNGPDNSWNVSVIQAGFAGRGLQIAGGYDTGNIYFRKGNSTWQAWNRILNATSDPYAAGMDQYVSTTSNVTFASVTASLLGTSSFANNATSASYALTASYALNAGSGGGGGLSALYIQDEGITQGTASYIDFTGAGVTATVTNGTASINIPGGGGGGTGGSAQTFTQSLSATTWSFAHSVNSRTPIVEVYDSSYNVIIPTAIYNPGPFQTNIYFDVSQSGYAIISTGGVLAVSGSNAVLNQNAAATTWSFNHDLHTQYPVFTIYDSNDDVIIPQRIHVVDTGSAEIYFSTPRTGKAIASVGGNVSFASQSLSTVTASFAATASSADDFLVRGTITAQTLLVQVITSSQDFVTGSTKFGTLLSNTHQFTGSVLVTGSLNVNGSNAILTNQTSSMSVLSSSYAATASFALNVPQTASFALSASNAVTASYIATASYALTASYATNAGAGAGFPYSGSAVITGSLLVSQSFVDFSQASWVSGSFTGSLNGTASWANNAISASYAAVAGNSPGFTVNFTQSVAAATWSFVHNLNTRNPIVQVYDTTYKQIIPNEIVATDSATVEVRFDYNQAGYAVASNGGGLYITGSTSRILQTVAATTWSFNHKLNTKYPAFEVFDSNDNVIIPAGIKAVDTDNAEIYFASPTTGIAIAEFSGINGLQDNAVSASFASTASYLNPVTSGYVVLTQVSQSLNFVDDAAAATGGVPLGGLYRNGNFIMIRLT